MPYSGGIVRAARTACSTPQKWKCSIVRWVRFWPFGIGCGCGVALDHDAADAALAELDGQPHADRAAADDDDLRIAGRRSLLLMCCAVSPR